MDADQFDRLVRVLQGRRSRRSLAGLLGGLALGGALTLEDQDDTAAKSKHKTADPTI